MRHHNQLSGTDLSACLQHSDSWVGNNFRGVRNLAFLCMASGVVACANAGSGGAGLGADSGGGVKHQILAEYLDSQDDFPKLRFYDSGLVSMNDRCPVRRTRLSAKMPAAYVNGRPIGFC
ncbi:MAG: hypothetical protein V3U86_04145 [Acidobacteriota bacterium]